MQHFCLNNGNFLQILQLSQHDKAITIYYHPNSFSSTQSIRSNLANCWRFTVALETPEVCTADLWPNTIIAAIGMTHIAAATSHSCHLKLWLFPSAQLSLMLMSLVPSSFVARPCSMLGAFFCGRSRASCICMSDTSRHMSQWTLSAKRICIFTQAATIMSMCCIQ